MGLARHSAAAGSTPPRFIVLAAALSVIIAAALLVNTHRHLPSVAQHRVRILPAAALDGAAAAPVAAAAADDSLARNLQGPGGSSGGSGGGGGGGGDLPALLDAFERAFRDAAHALRIDPVSLSTTSTFETLFDARNPMALALTLRAYCGALDAYDALAAAAERRPAAAAAAAAAAALADAHACMQRAHAVLLPWLRGAWPNPLALRRTYAGRGIAVAAGSRQAAWVYTHVRHLRRLGCALPVEVFYNGAADLDAEAIALLTREPGVSVLDLSRLVDAAAAALETWSMKAFTVLLSSFAEVILMDADAIFLRDPTLLFAEPPYARAGALFYRDRLVVPQRHQRAWLEAVLPAPLSPAARASRLYSGAGSHDAESGVAVYNKVKRFKGVLAAALLNSGAAKSYFYEHVYGDKETFWLAHEMVREPYAFAAHPAGILGPRPELRAGGPPGGDERANAQLRHHACAEQIMHLGEDGAPLWLNAWLVTRDKGALVDALRRRGGGGGGGGGGAAAAAPAWHPLEWWTTEPGDWYMDNGRSYNDGGLTCFAAPAESVPRRLSDDALAALQRIRDEFMALFSPPPLR